MKLVSRRSVRLIGGLLVSVLSAPGADAQLVDGACCLSDRTCAVVDPLDCVSSGGTFLGFFTSCPDPPGCAVGACCASDRCEVGLGVQCTDRGGVFAGPDSTCDEDCIGVCCLRDGSCQQLAPEACRGEQGAYQGPGTTCGDTLCSGACCQVDDCVASSPAACDPRDYLGLGTSCGGSDCVGACCHAELGCFNVGSAAFCESQGGEFQGRGTRCASTECLGACCLAGKDCTETTLGACGDLSGDYRGNGTGCDTHCPSALSNAITYQGQLRRNGAPYTGRASMKFSLFDVAVGGLLMAGPISVDSVEVVNGLFQIPLDFGANAFAGNARWLEIAVCAETCATPDDYRVLRPRHPVTATPFALYAVNGSGDSWVDNGADIHNTNSGRVGIGTTSPGAKLDVHTDIRSYRSQSAPAGFDQVLISGAAINSDGTGGLSGLGGLRLNDASGFGVSLAAGGGNVNVGTAAGDARLNVDGGTDATRNGGGYFMIGSPNSGNIVMDQNEIMARNDGAASTLHLNADGGTVAIGDNLGARLTVDGNAADGASLVTFTHNGPGAALLLRQNNPASTQSALRIVANGSDPGIHVTHNGTGLGLQVDGVARVEVLELIGADVAERFPVTDHPEPGMVVEIDPEHPGKLRVARGAYDRRVAGVVSGADGLVAGTILGNGPDSVDGPPVALSGRVWVRCDAAERPIEVGDLLTTSNTPGHAMAVADPARAVGATIGKAMTRLDEGATGMVLVLINLQ